MYITQYTSTGKKKVKKSEKNRPAVCRGQGRGRTEREESRNLAGLARRQPQTPPFTFSDRL
jgi:hypothetical protein